MGGKRREPSFGLFRSIPKDTNFTRRKRAGGISPCNLCAGFLYYSFPRSTRSASVAQWQSTGFVNQWLWVQIPPLASPAGNYTGNLPPFVPDGSQRGHVWTGRWPSGQWHQTVNLASLALRRFESCSAHNYFGWFHLRKRRAGNKKLKGGSSGVVRGGCGCSSMVEHRSSKPITRVRFPSPAVQENKAKVNRRRFPWFFYFNFSLPFGLGRAAVAQR